MNSCPPRPLVIATTTLAEAPHRWLASRCRLETVDRDSSGFNARLAEAVGLVVHTYFTVDAEVLAGAPRLAVVGRAGAGLDTVDVRACRDRGVEVVYTPDANTQAVVEYVVSLMCHALRPCTRLEQALRPDMWSDARRDSIVPRQMNELTLGILGLGRIGRRVAAVAAAIGFDVIYNDLRDIPDAERSGARPVAVEALFERADVLTVHIDGRASNRGFVSGALLDRMRDDALLLNTSRGFIVDNAAVAKFLRDRPAARAVLDVHEPEPFGDDYPLLGLPNATLLPHLAACTRAARENMAWVVRDVWAVLQNEPPRFPAPGESPP